MIPLSSISLSEDEINKIMKNFSYTIYRNDLYYRNNDFLVPVSSDGRKNGEPNIKTENSIKRIKYLIGIRDKTREILDIQVNGCTDGELQLRQFELEQLYENFANDKDLRTGTGGNRITNSANRTAFKHDTSYPLLRSLEILDSDGNFLSKSAIFTKRTINQKVTISSVETPVETLAVSLSEKARVDIPFMASILRPHENTDIDVSDFDIRFDFLVS